MATPDYTTYYSREHHREYKTAAYRLFKLTYAASAPHYYFINDFEMERIGYSVTGYDSVDEGALFRMRAGNLFPAFMAMVVGHGGKVSIDNIEDVVLIYNDIREHLSDWLEYVELRSGFRCNCPLEELYWFEQMAIDLHRNVDAYKRKAAGKKVANSVTHRFITSRQTRDGLPKLSSYDPIVPTIERLIRENEVANRDETKLRLGIGGQVKKGWRAL